jgi:peptide-methionine (R)-S-oxide reductase
MDDTKIPTEQELKDKLDREQYRVLREKGTEAPFSGKYWKEKKPGTYTCVACDNPLFPSTAKFDSDLPGIAGWPSFDQALPGAVKFEKDLSYGMERTEVLCTKCNSHLGHLFEDPKAKTGKHYCLNSVCLDLKETH